MMGNMPPYGDGMQGREATAKTSCPNWSSCRIQLSFEEKRQSPTANSGTWGGVRCTDRMGKERTMTVSL
jgi:hypothetical protein